MNCPNCGTPMDFIEKYNQWYCHYCREYAPRLNSQHSQRKQSPNRLISIIILIIVIVVIIIILASVGYFISNNDNENENDNDKYSDPTLKIDLANLEIDYVNEGYIAQNEVKFDYRFNFNNFTGKKVTIKWVVKLIENDTVYDTLEFNFTTHEYRASGEGSIYLSIGEKTPIPDKYRVEVYMDSKLMDSVEKEF